MAIAAISFAQKSEFEEDIIKTNTGDVKITFLGHGTLYLTFNDQVIHIDPVMRYADYTTLPKADLILITHHHGDHLDKNAIDAIMKDDTKIYLSQLCFDRIEMGEVMNNGDETEFNHIEIKSVEAYNIVHVRDSGDPFHPKGEGNGYVLSFGDTEIYVAGDTENVPEMANLKGVDIAFLPMNLPYTMTPEMVKNAAEMLQPKILYPYHFGKTDTNELVKLMDGSGVEVRIRQMQ